MGSVLILATSCSDNKPFDIIGTWGAKFNSMYREYTFTEKNLIIYDEYFGAQMFDYNIQNDTITVFRNENRKEVRERYFILHGNRNRLRFRIEINLIVDLKKVQTQLDLTKIFDENKNEFDSYVSEFLSRSGEQ